MTQLETLDRIESDLTDVERALARLGDGSYGTCEICGTALSESVLTDRPAAQLCSEHVPAPHQP